MMLQAQASLRSLTSPEPAVHCRSVLHDSTCDSTGEPHGRSANAGDRDWAVASGSVDARDVLKRREVDMFLMSARLQFLDLLVRLLLLVLLQQAHVSAGSLQQDAEALLALKNHFLDPRGILEDWNALTTPCTWFGISCPNSSSPPPPGLQETAWHPAAGGQGSLRVLGILLSDCSLSGNLSEDVVKLDALIRLDLSYNFLSGGVPRQTWQLPNLRDLRLNGNKFAGTLGQDGRWIAVSGLEHLDLSDNLLEGPIPSFSQFFNLTHLSLASNSFGASFPGINLFPNFISHIDLSQNSFTGSLPALSPLPSLRYLNISRNSLQGQIPTNLPNFPNLTRLDMSSNQLTGHIPAEIGGLAYLEILILGDNWLEGNIPAELGKCRRLEHVNLADNLLTGSIPAEIGLLSNLATLSLRNNRLTGEMPDSLGRCQNLVVLDSAINFLFGDIPTSLGGKGSKLQDLRIDHNSLSGGVPEQLGMTPGLSVLDLSNNSLQGSIPTSLGYANNLTQLFMRHNRLTGLIPKELGNLNLLQELDLSLNLLSGPIPPELSSLTQLNQLFLGGNNLSGTIPVALSQLVSLQYLHLEENALTGVIPAELSGCQGLRQLSLQGNQLTGPIPVSFGNLTALQELLDLSFNNLTGAIPLDLQSLVRLEALNLSHNQLSGSIPSFLLELGGTASLVELNLSYNLLTGEIPQADFTRNLSASSFLGNEGLCGLPLVVTCSSSFGRRHPETSRELALSTPASLGVVIAVASLTVIVVLSIGSVALFGKNRCSRRRHIPTIKTHSSKSLFRGSMSGRVWDRNMTFWDIMAATDELSADRQIGCGSCGIVYKAVMPDGEILAVKVLQHTHEQLDKKTTDGIIDLCKVRHRHLLRLLGFCAHKGRNLLIYEYMANGSLWDHLHGASYVALSGPYRFLSSPEQPGKVLDWPSRYEIALGTAKAISYLHNDCIPRIIHGNIKSTNILLDTHMLPYVCDYGLAGLHCPAASLDSDPTTSVSATSCGYLSPEYTYTKQGSEESDVYSFGVVLMELITGRMSADSSFPVGISSVVAWVRYCRSCRARIDRVLDTNLQSSISDLERYEMLLVLKIAYLSTKDVPSERPSMRNVLNLLKEVRRQTVTAGECCALFASKTLADILK